MTVDLFATEIEPKFEVVEQTELVDKKEGQRVKMLLNYTVVEKTKTFTVLRMDSLMFLPSSRRKF